MRTVTKKEIVEQVARKAKRRRYVVKDTLRRVLEEITEEIGKGNRLEFREFGIFEPVRRAPRIARNPRNQQRVPVPAKHAVRFKAGRILKQKLAAIPDAATAIATAVTTATATKTGRPSPRTTRPKPRPHAPR